MTLHVIFPAAGVGKRFGASRPKQFESVLGKTIFEWTLSSWHHGPITGRKVIVAEPTLELMSIIDPLPESYDLVQGGVDRAHSVFNALSYLTLTENLNDWVMVHDIARPCIRMSDVNKLFSICQETHIGGILACPLTDTIKKVSGAQLSTIDRSMLWAAQTPQCFKLGDLLSALSTCFEQGIEVTDESSAIEAVDLPVQIVEGSADNIKLTQSSDKPLIEYYLKQQGR